MENNVRQLLPIGSVVLLEDAEKKVMIYGIKQTDNETEVEYDYLGVVYPEGCMGDGTSFFFNHDQIATVCYRGFEDEERETFIDRLETYYDNKEQ